MLKDGMLCLFISEEDADNFISQMDKNKIFEN
jgi:hypothetical protein